MQKWDKGAIYYRVTSSGVPSERVVASPPRKVAGWERLGNGGGRIAPSPPFTLHMLHCRLELDDVEGVSSQQGPGNTTEVADTTPEIITMPSRFEKVQEKGFIDVWWLYDDGGQ